MLKDDLERERLFAALDEFRASLPEYREEDVMADVTEAVDAVRRFLAAKAPGPDQEAEEDPA